MTCHMHNITYVDSLYRIYITYPPQLDFRLVFDRSSSPESTPGGGGGNVISLIVNDANK